jgi:hypothetical protein
MGILDAVFLIGIVAFALMSAGFMDEGCTWLKIIGRETCQSGLPRVLPWPSPDGDFGTLSPPLISTQQTWIPLSPSCLFALGQWIASS